MADAKINLIITAKDQASSVFKKIGGGLLEVGKIATGFVVGDLLTRVIASAAAAIPDMIGKASDLNETISKVGVIFGESAGAIAEFADGADTALGQTKQQAMDAAATFATFGKAAGLSGESLVDFSTDLTGLSADLASFYNTSPTDAITAIGAALRGESEPIRRYGVLLDDATLRQKALEMGLVSTTKDALTPQQRALAAYQVILDQTTDAQGDFARTSDGLANQQRILKASFENIKTELGTALLPVINQVAGALVDWLSDPDVKAGIQRLAEGLGVLAMWLGENLPVAIGVLSAFWTGTLQPAFAALAAFWTTTLLPALTKVYNFLFVTMMPLWKALGTLFTEFAKLILANLSNQFKALVAVWQTILKPALDKLITWLKPVWEWFGKITGGIDGVARAISGVVGWIGTMVEKLSSLSLPDWLTPGSPTPFELGLRGITDAMQDLSKVTMGVNFIPGGRAMGAGTSNVNNWNMTINEAGGVVDPVQSFAMMRALAS